MMSPKASDFDQLPRWLSQAENLPSTARSVEMIQTHISWVFLADDHVYKLKKPVQFEFVDFSTAQRRRLACEDEMRLNRRLAPNVYLDVLPVYRDEQGRPTWQPRGEAIDWVVHMRRLPAEKMMDQVIRDGRMNDRVCEAVATMLSDFYQSEPPLKIAPEEYRQRIESHLRANYDDMTFAARHLPARTVQRITAALVRMLKLEPWMFNARVDAGRIIEGHGDLRPEHVCLTDPPVVFDCIEFSRDFRTIDIADELSFLAMECDFLEAGWFGKQISERCARHLADHVSPRLTRFYKSYRACVRAKVAALRSVQLEAHAAKEAHAEAEAYLDLADRHATGLTRPLVIVVTGRMGTGKSTLARALAKGFVAPLEQTDAVRRELFGASEKPAAYGEEIYTSENRNRVYQELGNRVGQHVTDGLTVIADGTFLSRASRESLYSVAHDHGARTMMVHCECPDDVARQRIDRRQKSGTDLSEARPELHRRQSFEAPDVEDSSAWIKIDTTTPIEHQVAAVLTALRERHTPD